MDNDKVDVTGALLMFGIVATAFVVSCVACRLLIGW